MWSGSPTFRSWPERQLLLAAAGVVLVASACSGRSTTSSGDDEQAGEAGHQVGGTSGAGGKGGVSGGGAGGKGGTGGTGGTGDVPYDDPGCPDIEPPAGVIECSVFDALSCGEGLACKPQLEHPYGSGCDQEVLNLRCVYPGAGEQGELCNDGSSECAGGFICVVGAAHGARCLRMCPLDGSIRCPSGYVCGPTDADGIGVCA